MDDLIERLHRDLDNLEPAPALLDDVRARADTRARRRKFGAGLLGITVAVFVIVGAWAAADREGIAPRSPRPPRTLAETGCSSRVTGRPGGRSRQGDGAAPADAGAATGRRPPHRATGRRPGRVGVPNARPAPGADPGFDVLVRDSLFFVPSSAPDRVWVGIVEGSQDDGRLTAVREVAIDGRVTVPDTRPPDGAWPVAAVDGNLVFQERASWSCGTRGPAGRSNGYRVQLLSHGTEHSSRGATAHAARCS